MIEAELPELLAEAMPIIEVLAQVLSEVLSTEVLSAPSRVVHAGPSQPQHALRRNH